jgi:NDP-sugar pyrophosphorylase family protein
MHFAILAAGHGSRLSAGGVESVKPLVELDGKPMMRRLIEIMADCGAESVSIAINGRDEAHPELVAECCQKAAADLGLKIDVYPVVTEDSMHTFLELSRHIPQGKFVLTTIDTVFNPSEFARYVDAFSRDNQADGYMAVTTFIDDEKPLYVAADADMHITEFGDSPCSTFVSGGIYGLCAPAAVNCLLQCHRDGISRMRGYQRALLRAGLNLVAYPMGKIVDVDRPEDIATAQQFLDSLSK